MRTQDVIEIFCVSASAADGPHVSDSAYNSPVCLDVKQSDKHVFISLLQLSGADGSGPVPRVLPAQSGAQESQTGERKKVECDLDPLYDMRFVCTLRRMCLLHLDHVPLE